MKPIAGIILVDSRSHAVGVELAKAIHVDLELIPCASVGLHCTVKHLNTVSHHAGKLRKRVSREKTYKVQTMTALMKAQTGIAGLSVLRGCTPSVSRR